MSIMRRKSLLLACHGSMAVEFALIGSVFLMVILGIVQGGLLLWAKAAIEESASRAARCTAITSSYCTDPAADVTPLLNGWGVSGIVPSVSVSVASGTTCNNTAGHFSLVTVKSTGPVLSNILPAFSNIVLSSSSCYPSGI